jgi:hypothetical protein
LITLICLVIVVGLALLAGFLLRKFTNKRDE